MVANDRLKIGFTGTQDGMTSKQIRTLGLIILVHMPAQWPAVEWHHGDCIGADEECHRLVRALRFRVVLHPPDNDSKRAFCKLIKDRVVAMEPAPYLERNRDIVDETRYLIAAPKGEEVQRSGTWSTVRYARQQGRPIYFTWPDGSVTFEMGDLQKARRAL